MAASLTRRFNIRPVSDLSQLKFKVFEVYKIFTIGGGINSLLIGFLMWVSVTFSFK